MSDFKRKVTKSYDKDIDAEAGKFSEIFKDLINNFTSLTIKGVILILNYPRIIKTKSFFLSSGWIVESLIGNLNNGFCKELLNRL